MTRSTGVLSTACRKSDLRKFGRPGVGGGDSSNTSIKDADRTGNRSSSTRMVPWLLAAWELMQDTREAALERRQRLSTECDVQFYRQSIMTNGGPFYHTIVVTSITVTYHGAAAT